MAEQTEGYRKGLDPSIKTEVEEHPERNLTDAERAAGITSYEDKVADIEKTLASGPIRRPAKTGSTPSAHEIELARQERARGRARKPASRPAPKTVSKTTAATTKEGKS